MHSPKTQYALNHTWASSTLLRALGYIDAADAIQRLHDQLDAGDPVPAKKAAAQPAPASQGQATMLEPKPATGVIGELALQRGRRSWRLTAGTEVTADGLGKQGTRVRITKITMSATRKPVIDVIVLRNGKARIISLDQIRVVHR